MNRYRSINVFIRGVRLSVPRLGQALWQRIPFAWALQMTFTNFFHRRALRAIRSNWLGNEARPSTIESSYLLLHQQHKDRIASSRNARRQLDTDTLIRVQDAARRTH